MVVVVVVVVVQQYRDRAIRKQQSNNQTNNTRWAFVVVCGVRIVMVPAFDLGGGDRRRIRGHPNKIGKQANHTHSRRWRCEKSPEKTGNEKAKCE